MRHRGKRTFWDQSRVKKRKAVFLDRDGTLVVHEHYLSSPEQLKLLPNAVEGLRLFQEHGFLVVVVTNQSGIARGIFDEERLSLIHKKLAQMLEEKGIVLDGIYYCPHLKEGVVEQYKIECDCRKPLPGMLLDAAHRYNIDLPQSLMVGDSEVDMQAGRNAGCTCMLIKSDRANGTSNESFGGVDYVVNDLLDAARIFLNMAK